MTRYIWERRGIWDNDRKCWVVWPTAGQSFDAHPDFRAALLRAINEHEATMGYQADRRIARGRSCD